MKTRLYIIVYMVVIAAVFGGGVSGIYLATAKTLERNQAFIRDRALCQVFDLSTSARLRPEEAARLVAERIDIGAPRHDPESGRELTILTAYASAARDEVAAYGIMFRGLGVWGPIEGILAVTPDLSRTVGLVVVDQKETPGLGGRIAEREFTSAFRDGIAITPFGTNGRHLVVSASAPEPGSAAHGHRVEAITGATQTSMAMERVLNENIAAFRRIMATAQ